MAARQDTAVRHPHLPEGWLEAPLGTVADVRFSSVDKLAYPSEEPVRLCNYLDVYKNDYITGDLGFMGASATQPEIDRFGLQVGDGDFSRFVGEEKLRELQRYAVRPYDIMIALMGTVGRCCVVPHDIGTALSSKHVWTVSLDLDRYSPSLACWQINNAPWVLRQLRRDEQGGVMTAIRSETLRALLLPVPRLQEMDAIDAVVRESTAYIAREENELDKLRLLKSGLTSDLLTGRVRVPPDLLENPA